MQLPRTLKRFRRLAILLVFAHAGQTSLAWGEERLWTLDRVETPAGGGGLILGGEDGTGYQERYTQGRVDVSAGSMRLLSRSVTEDRRGNRHPTESITEALFDQPPRTFRRGETVRMGVRDGASNLGGLYFHGAYDPKRLPVPRSDRGEWLSFASWDSHRESSKSFSFVAPQVYDGELRIRFSHWNRPELFVEWVYRPGEGRQAELENVPGVDCAAKRRQLLEKLEYAPPGASVDELRRGIIGRALAVTGDVRVEHCEGGSSTLEKGDPVSIGDCIVSGTDGRVRVQMGDRDNSRNAGPSVINTAANSRMCFEKFMVSFGDPPENNFVIRLVKGMVRAFFKGWGRNSSVSIRTGVTVCGIRGSDVVVSHDPVQQRLEIWVREGHMDVENTVTGDSLSLAANQKLRIANGKSGESRTFSQEEWGQLLESNGIEEIEAAVSAEEDKPCVFGIDCPGDGG